jgi:uncharacterized protein YgbK (DUF1537 family)
MSQEVIKNAVILEQYPDPDIAVIDRELAKELEQFDRKIIVLDDDPTGTQTVHGISVFTDWTDRSLRDGFAEKNSMFYILTNSRGMLTLQTEEIHKEIISNIEKISRETGKSYCLISRSDSTLRGHYPRETEVLRNAIEKNGRNVDGEILAPFFLAGGRLTLENVHYVREGDKLIPAGQTEFARDKSFGYSSSHMGEWCEEKTKGIFKAEDVTFITLEEIRSRNYESILRKLMNVQGFNKVVVNAVVDDDMKVFVTALLQAIRAGKEYLFRTAAGFPQVIGGVVDRALLRKEELVTSENKNGGIVLVGSHTHKTTMQMNVLLNSNVEMIPIEFDVSRVFATGGLEAEADRVLKQAETQIRSGYNVVIYTSRKRLVLDTKDKDIQLEVSVRISNTVTSIIGRLEVQPKFIIAKGGITSSDVGTKALKVKKALVLGQILPGIPVWRTGSESKFPHMAYVIFPGNVGDENALRDVVTRLC